MRVLTCGVFNICHAGHIELFEYCQSLGTCIVGINGDRYCRTKYGDKAVSIEQRIYVLKSCRYVDEVHIFEENDPIDLIARVEPNLFVKGPDYLGKELPEQQVLRLMNIPLLLAPGSKIQSTSILLAPNKAVVNL